MSLSDGFRSEGAGVSSSRGRVPGRCLEDRIKQKGLGGCVRKIAPSGLADVLQVGLLSPANPRVARPPPQRRNRAAAASESVESRRVASESSQIQRAKSLYM